VKLIFKIPLIAMSIPATTSFRLGLTGWPLEHSLSPTLHTAALGAAELDGEYQLYPIPPLPRGATALEELLAGMRRGELHGLNVTIPHKQAVLPFLDALTPVAQAAGAANTIFRRDGQITGDNTDVQGFLTDLKSFAGHLFFEDRSRNPHSAAHALILGAGGAARGVIYGLVQAGWNVHCAARRRQKAQELVSAIQTSSGSGDGPDFLALDILPLDRAAISDLLPAVSLLVNTTPAGMIPKVDASPWPDGLPFPPLAVVYDLIYNPAETAFVRAARAAGLAASNGLGMLIEQAALSFEIWTGQTAPRQAMQHAAQEALKPV
jgi:shikimate dehydrogenase